jgi:prolyl 4-hydroxylase
VDAVPALGPGDLNKMFERIVRTAPGNRTLTEKEREELLESGMTDYSVIVHSQPSELPATEVSAVLDKSLPPWVITFENFLTPEECEALIALGHEYKYERSEDVGKLNFDGSHEGVQNDRRTSNNAWCSTFHGCRDNEVPTRVHERMSKVMGIPAVNSEDLQLLKYEVGQFYRTHHDFIPHQVDRQSGPRLLTFFLYLSDAGGGGTNFPTLDMTINPKQGRALLWPSVYDSDPLKDDPRMFHQALEVEEGTKFAANGWIHMYDYVTPQAEGCN